MTTRGIEQWTDVHGDEARINHGWCTIDGGEEGSDPGPGIAADETEAVADDLPIDVEERRHVGDGGDHGEVEERSGVGPGAVSDIRSTASEAGGEEEAEGGSDEIAIGRIARGARRNDECTYWAGIMHFVVIDDDHVHSALERIGDVDVIGAGGVGDDEQGHALRGEAVDAVAVEAVAVDAGREEGIDGSSAV